MEQRHWAWNQFLFCGCYGDQAVSKEGVIIGTRIRREYRVGKKAIKLFKNNHRLFLRNNVSPMSQTEFEFIMTWNQFDRDRILVIVRNRHQELKKEVFLKQAFPYIDSCIFIDNIPFFRILLLRCKFLVNEQSIEKAFVGFQPSLDLRQWCELVFHQ